MTKADIADLDLRNITDTGTEGLTLPQRINCTKRIY